MPNAKGPIFSWASRRIGILGISGNPPHWGHVRPAVLATIQQQLSDTYVIINNQSPDPKPDRESPQNRLDMGKAAYSDLSDYPVDVRDRIIVSDVEIARGGTSWAADTLAYFRDLYPRRSGNQLYYIIGEDLTQTVSNWHRAQEVLDNIDVIVVSPRTPVGIKDLPLWQSRFPGKEVRAIQVSDQDVGISSTRIRELLSAGKMEAVRALLPPAVFKLIIERNLYRKLRGT